MDEKSLKEQLKLDVPEDRVNDMVKFLIGESKIAQKNRNNTNMVNDILTAIFALYKIRRAYMYTHGQEKEAEQFDLVAFTHEINRFVIMYNMADAENRIVKVVRK